VEWPRAEDLLAGPRGRRLCWSLLEPGDYPGWDLVWTPRIGENLTGLTAELAACVARTDLDSKVMHADQLTLQAAISDRECPCLTAGSGMPRARASSSRTSGCWAFSRRPVDRRIWICPGDLPSFRPDISPAAA
jgi:hypothetical protein